MVFQERDNSYAVSLVNLITIGAFKPWQQLRSRRCQDKTKVVEIDSAPRVCTCSRTAIAGHAVPGVDVTRGDAFTLDRRLPTHANVPLAMKIPDNAATLLSGTWSLWRVYERTR